MLKDRYLLVLSSVDDEDMEKVSEMTSNLDVRAIVSFIDVIKMLSETENREYFRYQVQIAVDSFACNHVLMLTDQDISRDLKDKITKLIKDIDSQLTLEYKVVS